MTAADVQMQLVVERAASTLVFDIIASLDDDR